MWALLLLASSLTVRAHDNRLSLTNATSSDEILGNARLRLQKQFDKWLQQPQEYAKLALGECSVFPEGEIYPFALPAMAYCNLALRNPQRKPETALKVAKLIELLIPMTAKRVQSPGGDLMRLTAYQKQGTFLSTLNLTLGNYALIASDNKHKPLHAHISRLLDSTLHDLDGKPIESYLEYTWYFDTIMALASLRLFEDANGLPRRSAGLLKKHLQWRHQHAMDKATGLPIAYSGGLPRGCDLSMQICLLADMDLDAARKLYHRYVTHHWADYGMIAGFTEWQKTKSFLMTGDIDSGPLFLGIGMTATGVGIGAALAMADSDKVAKLATELERLPSLVKSLTGSDLFDATIPINPFFLTGFLYGDAVLFYSLSIRGQ